MSDFMLGVTTMMAVDAVATLLLLNAARNNPFIRRRLVESFKLLVGDASLRVNVVDHSPEEFTDCGDEDEEQHEERCEGSEGGGCCTDEDSDDNQVDGLRPEDQGEDDEEPTDRN